MNDKIKEHLSNFHEHDAFLPTKTILLTGTVDEDLYDKVMKNIHTLDSVSGTITLKINSPGGEITHARAIYDAIRGCKNVVRGIVYGEASSSASIILQACDERIMSPNSEMMIHIGTEGYTEDNPSNVERYREHNKKIGKWIEDVYLEKIKEKKKKYTRKKLKKLLEYDTFLLPKVALDYGLIDKIGEIQ